MSVYIAILCVGLLVVAVLFIRSQDQQPDFEGRAGGEEREEIPENTIEEEMPSLLRRLGLEQGQSAQQPPPTQATEPAFQKSPPVVNKASLTAESSAGPDLLTEDWPAKYKKLETLFAEKSGELEKSEKSLESEIKNRKEFNKVKDALEKELKDRKDKIHQIQLELTAAQTEAENQKKKVAQLEEKTKTLENEIKNKEHETADLNTRLQKAETAAKAKTEPQTVTSTPAVVPEQPAKPETKEKSEEPVNPPEETPQPTQPPASTETKKETPPTDNK